MAFARRMQDPVPFVEVRLPARTLVIGSATRRGGARADLLVQPSVRAPAEPSFLALCLFDQVDPDALRQVAQDLSQRHGATIRLADPEAGCMVFEVDGRRMPARLAGPLLAFQAAFEAPWIHFEAGRAILRAPAVDCEPGECVARLRRTLDYADVDAPVDVVRLAGAELAPWHALRAWHGAVEADLDALAPSGAPSETLTRLP